MAEEFGWWRWLIQWESPYRADMLAIKEHVYSGKTKYQKVDILITYTYGKCLVLDGKIQSSECDEWIYHEALVHPAMLTHDDPKRVAIIGGGEGATLREVLRHNVEQVVMVDLDEELVNLCRKYLPEWNKGAFDDPRVRLLFMDGRKFLEETDEEFDVIILDLTDPVPGTPSVFLYTKEFYSAVEKRLSDGGLMVTQATSTFYSLDVFATIYNTIASVFPIARGYHAYVPSFEAMWGFVIASRDKDPCVLDETVFKERLSSIKGELRFYNWEIHRAMFALPPYVLKKIKEARIATDDNPVCLPI